MSSRDYENLTTNFDCIYCQNFNMKTKLILGFLFILMTLVGLHNTHVLNYTRNIFFKKIAYQTLENILKLLFLVVTNTPENEIFFHKILFGK